MIDMDNRLKEIRDKLKKDTYHPFDSSVTDIQFLLEHLSGIRWDITNKGIIE